jgi:putative oxidoreductase
VPFPILPNECFDVCKLRIMAAFMYVVHGTQKLFGFPAPFPMPHLCPLFLAGGIIETFGGLLLLLGLFTRPVAFILSGEMAIAHTHMVIE